MEKGKCVARGGEHSLKENLSISKPGEDGRTPARESGGADISRPRERRRSLKKGVIGRGVRIRGKRYKPLGEKGESGHYEKLLLRKVLPARRAEQKKSLPRVSCVITKRVPRRNG